MKLIALLLIISVLTTVCTTHAMECTLRDIHET